MLAPDNVQVVILLALAAGALTISEYTTSSPSLFEFRAAPPFNRIRFGMLFVTVFLLALLARGGADPSSVTMFIHAIGSVVGAALDFPYSPVRLVVLMLPQDASVAQVLLVRAAAGLSCLVALVSLAVFLIAVRLKGWPLHAGDFNVWINLPTFDPTSAGDVVERLERDSRVNITLGFILPFLLPATIRSAASLSGAMTLENPQTMVWTVAAWAFLPASLFMRGMAMSRIAALIERKRKETDSAESGLVPA